MLMAGNPVKVVGIPGLCILRSIGLQNGKVWHPSLGEINSPVATISEYNNPFFGMEPTVSKSTNRRKSDAESAESYTVADVLAIAEAVEACPDHVLKFDCPRYNEAGEDVWSDLNQRVLELTALTLEQLGFRPIESGSRGGQTVRRGPQFRLYLPLALSESPLIAKFGRIRGDRVVISNTYLLLDVWEAMEHCGNTPNLEGIKQAA